MPNVLIADDNSANVLLIRDFCKDMDFEPMIVEAGRAMVDSVRASPPDVIFMDIEAPLVDGLSATIELRGLRQVSEQMMIIGLNNGSPAAAAACRIAGMNQILAKPLQPERLMAALRAARAPLNLQAAAAEAKQGHEEPETEAVLLQRTKELFGAIPPNASCARLYYINAPKLKGEFGEDWADVSSTIETITVMQIEQAFGASAVYKKFTDLDFLLMAPGMSFEECATKCQAVAKEICQSLAEDEAGAKFHFRAVMFDARPAVAPPPAPVQVAVAASANTDILPWARLVFWPVWDAQKRKFPIHSVRVDRDAAGAYLPEACAAREQGRAQYNEAVDISAVAAFVDRLDGYDGLEQPKLTSLPLHLSTLGAPEAMARYLRYAEKIPKKIRERLIIEIHDVPPETKTLQIAELQKPILPHCLHTMLVVPSSYPNFGVLKQISGQIVQLALPEQETPDMAALKQFGARAKQSGLTLACSMVREPVARDWVLANCRYALGPAIAAPLNLLGPSAKFIG